MTTSQQTHAVRAYPFSEPDRLNLDPMYAWLREHEPVARIQMPYGEPAWLVTRYADARTVMGDPRFSRAAVLSRDEPRVTPRPTDPSILSMDPPEHTRLRRLVTKAFTVRRVEELRSRVQEIADELVDRMVETGPPADLVDTFALPLPVAVICELLGVPFADRGRFRVWSDGIMSTTSLPLAQIQEHYNSLVGYLAGLVEQRRREPTDANLLGSLIQVRDEGDRLSEEELIGLALALLVAGHETTASQIPNFVYVLQTHPDLLRQLRERPELVPDAVEELMRWIPLGAASAFARYAVEDVELSEFVVPAGDPVLVSLAAANRDDRVFPDPDGIDLTRKPNPHVGFGHGAHHCLGAPLARLELQVALATLLRRLPNLRFAVAEEEIPWKKGLFVRGPERLPVAW
jgi:cytochrome P450